MKPLNAAFLTAALAAAPLSANAQYAQYTPEARDVAEAAAKIDAIRGKIGTHSLCVIDRHDGIVEAEFEANGDFLLNKSFGLDETQAMSVGWLDAQDELQGYGGPDSYAVLGHEFKNIEIEDNGTSLRITGEVESSLLEQEFADSGDKGPLVTAKFNGFYKALPDAGNCEIVPKDY